MLAELWCDQKTRGELGEAGLAEVTAGLWAQDCQSCGLSLGGEPPALCVDELSGYATAGLGRHRASVITPGRSAADAAKTRTWRPGTTIGLASRHWGQGKGTGYGTATSTI
jgi:hypothetical protein